MNPHAVTPEEAPRERYRGERLELLNRVPSWARRVLMAGNNISVLCGVFKRAWNLPVVAVEFSAKHQSVTVEFAEHMLSAAALREGVTFAERHFDQMIVLDLPRGTSDWIALASLAKSSLSPDGAGLLLLHDTRYMPPLDSLEERAASLGYTLYHRWMDPIIPTRTLSQLVPDSYAPFDRARQLAKEGMPDAAYNELMGIPHEVAVARELLGPLHAEALSYLEAVAKTSYPDSAQQFLLRAQGHYFHTSRFTPESAMATDAYASLLHRAGAGALARELRDCFCQSYPEIQLPSPQVEPSAQVPDNYHALEPDSNFTWPGRTPRVLFITHPSPHYGLDLLFDGLCRSLGPSQVIEWPHKPALHGAPMQTLGHYPCAFDWPATETNLEVLLEDLRNGGFDLAIHGDTETNLPADTVMSLLRSAQQAGTPIVHVDAMDECVDMQPHLATALPGIDFLLYFKRETAQFMDYGPRTLPLPFSYSTVKVHPHGSPRTRDFFWAGNDQFGFRRLYIDHLRKRFGPCIDLSYPPADYARELAASRIGVSLFGKGFDTVRYWELPAHGCLLLSQRLPIVVPHNFVDGESAVYFESIKDLDEKLDFYLAHPDEAERIARAGEARFLKHHTSEARARQFLHHVHEHVARTSS